MSRLAPGHHLCVWKPHCWSKYCPWRQCAKCGVKCRRDAAEQPPEAA